LSDTPLEKDSKTHGFLGQASPKAFQQAKLQSIFDKKKKMINAKTATTAAVCLMSPESESKEKNIAKSARIEMKPPGRHFQPITAFEPVLMPKQSNQQSVPQSPVPTKPVSHKSFECSDASSDDEEPMLVQITLGASKPVQTMEAKQAVAQPSITVQ